MTLHVLPTERHVALARAAGARAETRGALRERLLGALAPDVAFARRASTRLALASVLPEVTAKNPLLAPIARRGGTAWEKMVDAVDAALTRLHACAVPDAALEAVAREGGALGHRARLLHDARLAKDRTLGARGLTDLRAAPAVLSEAIARRPPGEVVDLVGDPRLVAKWILAWTGADLAWWRALDRALAGASGGATISVPAIDYALDLGSEKEAPLDLVAAEIARGLEEAPATFTVDAPLGDLRLATEAPSVRRAEVRRCQASDSQARAASDAIFSALAGRGGKRAAAQLNLLFGDSPAATLDAVAVVLPNLSSESLKPILEALAEAGIPAEDRRAGAAQGAGVLRFAMHALTVSARGLKRREVAALLRSGYVDPAVAFADPTGEAVSGLARALEDHCEERAEPPVLGLEATARAAGEEGSEERAALARKVAEILGAAGGNGTRAAHAGAAESVWRGLGVDARIARSLRSDVFAEDSGDRLARAELRAIAADARAFGLLEETLAEYVESARALGLEGREVPHETFLHELGQALAEPCERSEAWSRAICTGPSRWPEPDSTGCVRIAEPWELAGLPLDVLVVVDANDGALPKAEPDDPLFPEALAARLRTLSPRAAPASADARAALSMGELAAAAACARRVVLCLRERDDAGALLAPAPVVAWLERGSVARSSWTGSPLVAKPITRHELELGLLARGEGAAGLEGCARRARIERAREALFEGENLEPSPITGRLTPSAILARVLGEETGGGARPLAVTALERIAACAFQGYAANVLRATERRAREEIPDAREGGTLLHAALAAAFNATRALFRDRPRDRERIVDVAMKASAGVLRKDAAASALRRLTLEKLAESVRAVVLASIDDEAWDFERAELTFSDSVLDDGQTKVTFRGSVDRVDRGAARAVRVMDYKSSDSGAKHATKQLGSTTFQIALYARVAAEALGAERAEGVYLPAQPAALPLKARRVQSNDKAWSVAHEPVVAGRPRFETAALEIVSAFRGGALVPLPMEKQACERCSFDGGCRKPRFVIRGNATDEE